MIFDYAPVAHWVWGPDGMFSTANVDANGNFAGWKVVLDYAGGTVVHINAGVAGLVAAIMLGKRRDTGPGHNMVLTFIGTGLLWVGWFGFNAGSAVTAGVQAGMAMTVTQVATAVAALTWMFVEWAHRGKPTVIGICSGAVAGLVAITPASGYVGPLGSIWIGIACGIGCYWGATGLKHTFGYDDALDTFGVHGVGGIIGAILTGVFAVNQYSGHAGLIEGNPGQVVNQVIGVATVIIYDAIVSLHHPEGGRHDDWPARLGRSRARRSRSRPARRNHSVSLEGRGPPRLSPTASSPWAPLARRPFSCPRSGVREGAPFISRRRGRGPYG